jgi:hypothetical protein
LSCDRTTKEPPVSYVVNLSGYRLKKIPDSVLQNQRITELHLGAVGFGYTVYPPLSALGGENGTVSTPEYSNNLQALPDGICSLKYLRKLNVNFNGLKVLPECFPELENLEFIDLSFNKGFQIMTELNKLKQLKSLRILQIVDVAQAKGNEETIRSVLRDVDVHFTLIDYSRIEETVSSDSFKRWLDSEEKVWRRKMDSISRSDSAAGR